MNYEKFTHNIKILSEFEKGLGQSVDFKIKDLNGEIRKVSKDGLANWMIEGKEEKNAKTLPEEKIVYGASGDIDGTTVFIDKKRKDSFIRESYYQPRSEEEKNGLLSETKRGEKRKISQMKN